jgi:hypothetical protein
MPTAAERVRRVQVSHAYLRVEDPCNAGTRPNSQSLSRRGLIDMRKRFRGNQPLAGASEMEGGKRNKPEQLYAGKPAFESVKEISGDEVQMDPEKTRGL